MLNSVVILLITIALIAALVGLANAANQLKNELLRDRNKKPKRKYVRRSGRD